MLRTTIVSLSVLLAAASPAAAQVLQPTASGWRLPRAPVVERGSVEPLDGNLPYGMHGSGPALAALDAVPPGVTAPASIDSFDLTYHGGPIQPATTSYAIYWDPSGAVMDSEYRPLIDRYLTDTAGSALYAMLTQYAGSNGSVTASSTFGGSIVDTDPIPKTLTRANILAEVAKVLDQFTFTAAIGDEVFLLLPHGALPANGYCAYHGGFSYKGGKFALAVIPYADAAGCGEDYDFQSPNGDLVADGGVAEVSTAQVNMITDPLLNGWYDDANGEVGDLCFEDFGVGINAFGADLVVLASNGKTHSYEVPEAYSQSALGCAPSL
jgi:hypothetical protein